jgi:hypothetical protein
MSPDLNTLTRWCLQANAAAYEFCGVSNTCIQTSMALVEFLRLQGLEAEPFRARVIVHPTREYEEHVLGRPGVGSFGGEGHRSQHGGWCGHLAVSCGQYVLDPTLDQFEAEGLAPTPTVFFKPKDWDVPPADRPWQGGAWHRWQEGNLDIGHARHPRQVGWKSKPAARPSAWADVVEIMIEMDR